MNTVNINYCQSERNQLSSANQAHDQLAEHDRIIDSHLVRITRLQMLLNLEEARLLRSQQERRELRVLLGIEDMN